MNDKKSVSSPRLISLERVRAELLPGWFDPVPSPAATRKFLNRAGVRRFKTNPAAKAGGGHCFYVLTDIEEALSRRICRPIGK